MSALHHMIGVLFGAVLLCAVSLAYPQALPGDIRSHLHVNGSHPLASDTNPGTAELPLQTIHRAAQVAAANHTQHVGTRIVIYPGTYRESITLDLRGAPTDAPIVFEATEPGTVIISGSEVWTDWAKVAGANVYTHPWPYRWGLSANPWEDEHIALAPIVRRREMLFVDGTALDQVLSASALTARSFYIAEDKGLIYVALPGKVDMRQAVIEVSTREYTFAAYGANNLTLRGLTFQHASSTVQESAVRIVDAAQITIEDCQFIWNNWIGLGAWNTAHLLVRRNVANDNGGLGMTLWKIAYLLLEDNDTSQNNWRGARGGFYGWAVAGIKSLRIHHGIYRRHRAGHNLARGFWLDYDNTDIRIEAAWVCRNALDGMFIEASQGPVLLKDSTMCHNKKGAGILSTNSRTVTLEGNVVYNNYGPQIKVNGDRERQVTDWQTGEQMVLSMAEWTLRHNIIVTHLPGQLLIDVPPWQHFLQSLTGEGNLWYHPVHSQVFKVGGSILDFSGWQAITGQDVGSRFAAPRFIDLYRRRSDLVPETPPPASRPAHGTPAAPATQ